MENASYALRIAAATLIAVMIIALIVFVFQKLRNYQQSQEDAVTRENMAQFNKTFEVYDKSLMYGTDVLSCLNQAESNNQKYVYNIYSNSNAGATISEELIEELMVQVKVTINSPLQEEIKVYYRDASTGTIMQVTESQMKSSGLSNGYNFKPFSTSNSKGFSLPDITFYYFTKETSTTRTINQNTKSYSELLWSGVNNLATSKLIPGTYYTKMKAIEEGYYLVAESSDSDDILNTGMLIALLSTVTEYEQTIYNDTYTGTGYTGSNGWYSATWTTAVYDFKTRKFECIDIGYNETGYINYLEFKEIDNY